MTWKHYTKLYLGKQYHDFKDTPLCEQAALPSGVSGVSPVLKPSSLASVYVSPCWMFVGLFHL